VSLLKDAACQLSLFGSLNYWHFEIKMLGLLIQMPSKLRFFNEHVFFFPVSIHSVFIGSMTEKQHGLFYQKELSIENPLPTQHE
jgi:hypothetical protein